MKFYVDFPYDMMGKNRKLLLRYGAFGSCNRQKRFISGNDIDHIFYCGELLGLRLECIETVFLPGLIL